MAMLVQFDAEEEGVAGVVGGASSSSFAPATGTMSPAPL